MLKLRKQNKRKESGQGMVEFSIILTVLIGLFVGAFELMTLYSKRTDLEAATRLGARQASESWVTDGLTDAQFQVRITDYLRDEFERLGYSNAYFDSNVAVNITAFDYDPTSGTFNSNGTICTYGQYIQVNVQMEWDFVVLPLNALVGGGAPAFGTMEEELLLRCWRGT
ncbi:MAG: TadE/TadG family type IV pilus assembly protein [Chloroflexota bacterium]